MLFSVYMSTNGQEMRFCVECQLLLDASQFSKKRARNLCREHTNKQHAHLKRLKWTNNPLERKANVIWQIAYVDSHKTFKLRLGMKTSHVMKLIEEHNFKMTDDIRFIPIDPLQPLSMTNYCIVDGATKFDMCFNWRRLQSPEKYRICFDPRCIQKIYGSSSPELAKRGLGD